MRREAMRIDLPFLVADTDRHGNRRVYFRRGGRKVRIREQPGSPEFLVRYEALAAAAEAGTLASESEPDAKRPRPGTWRWLVVAYLGSPVFAKLDPHTRAQRRGALKQTCLEPVFPGAAEIYAEFPIARITTKALRVLRDRKDLAGLPAAANHRVKAIRALYRWALEAEHVSANPARDLTKVALSGEGCGLPCGLVG